MIGKLRNSSLPNSGKNTERHNMDNDCKAIVVYKPRSRIVSFFKKNALGIGALLLALIIGIFTRGTTIDVDLATIWWWTWVSVTGLVALALLILILWRIKPHKWPWKRILITTAVIAAVLTLPVYVVYKMNDEINRERDGKSSLVNRPTSSGVASRTTTSPSSVLLKAGSEWSEWSTMPLDMKASFLASRKGLVIMFRDVSGGEATVWDDPEKKVDLTALGVMAEAVAFRVRSETGDLPFTVHYTPKGG